MRKSALTLLLLLVFSAPPAISAQDFAIGARAGTAGFGGEVALGLGNNLVARGGIGFFPFDLPEIPADDFEFTVTPPNSFITAGLDLYPFGSGIRLMGGMLWRSGNIEIETPVTAGEDVGDVTVDVSGTLFGELAQGTSGPFVGIGFGKHTKRGFGLFMDLAVAFMGSTDVELSASSNILAIPGIQAEIDQLENDVEEEAGEYLQYWPVLSIGFKIPLGGSR